MVESKKSFDAVEMMRSIREEVSAQIEGMTLEEELEWLASQNLGDPYLERLRKKLPEPTPQPRGGRRVPVEAD